MFHGCSSRFDLRFCKVHTAEEEKQEAWWEVVYERSAAAQEQATVFSYRCFNIIHYFHSRIYFTSWINLEWKFLNFQIIPLEYYVKEEYTMRPYGDHSNILAMDRGSWDVKCQGTFYFKGSKYVLLLCAVSQGLSLPYQFLENRNEQSCTQFSELRLQERAPAWIPFSDSLQWPLLKCNLFSYASLTQGMECFLALWRLLFAWLCFCSVFFTA